MKTSFNISENDIMMVKGDTLAFGIELDGVDVLSSAFFTVKKNPNGEALIQKSIGDGISRIGAGQYAVRIAPEDTIHLDADLYQYDLQIASRGESYTILLGVFEIVESV